MSNATNTRFEVLWLVRRFLALVPILACGDNLQGVPFDQFEDALLRARCARFTRCGLVAQLDSCESFFRERPNFDRDTAVAARVVHYSGAAAELCLDALASQSCDTSSREGRLVPEVCEKVFAGQLDGGADCASDEECESGVCVKPSCSELCCSGVCRPKSTPQPAGAPCEIDLDCRHDLFCNRDNRCSQLIPEGGPCDDDNECVYGSACIGPSEFMSGTCRPAPALGEECPYLRCAEIGAVCRDGLCVPLGLAGSPCTTAKECSPFLLCNRDSQRCEEVPSLGEPCSTICAGEAWCDGSLCLAPKENGEPCGASDQCLSLNCEEGVAFDACGAYPRCFP